MGIAYGKEPLQESVEEIDFRLDSFKKVIISRLTLDRNITKFKITNNPNVITKLIKAYISKIGIKEQLVYIIEVDNNIIENDINSKKPLQLLPLRSHRYSYIIILNVFEDNTIREIVNNKNI